MALKYSPFVDLLILFLVSLLYPQTTELMVDKFLFKFFDFWEAQTSFVPWVREKLIKQTHTHTKKTVSDSVLGRMYQEA